MLAAVSVIALLMGIAAGGLVASVLALGIGGVLSLAEVENGANIGLVIGVVAGLAIGGWVAGRRSSHSSRFHGAVTGLALASLIMATAKLGGSPAGTTVVIWLAVVSIVISGFTGWLAGRRKETPT